MPDITLMGATYPDVPAVTLPSGNTSATFYYPSEIEYAGAPVSAGNANKANAILYGTVDSTSTSTAFTATVEGLTELYDGVCVLLHNGVVTSASGFTININGLGAKPAYSNMTNATRETTIFNVAYTMLFIYSSALNSGAGGWWCYRGYDANTNTIGYQLRTNSSVRNVSDTARYYKLYFTSADNTMWVPASVNSTNNATAARPVNQRPIDPFGPIVYTSANTNFTAGSNLTATTIWQQYTLALGYSFNRTDAALTMTAERPVYVKCAPQADGSAIMDADTPIVQTLPTTADGKIYIYLGLAYSATNIELQTVHPVYWHDGTAIRLWTGAVDSGGDVTMTEEEVDAAVNAAFGYSVTVNLTNPANASHFSSANVYISESGEGTPGIVWETGELLASFSGPADSVTVETSMQNYGLVVTVDGLSPSTAYPITTTGGVEYIGVNGGMYLFHVTSDGTATLDGIDYDD